MRSTLSIFGFFIFFTLLGQHEPGDFLPKEFHQERRDLVRKKMPKNSVAVFFSNPIRNRANDVDFIYHQDPNFYYLTGYREPHGVLLIFKDKQKSSEGSYNEIIFIQPRDAIAEMWTGRRLGISGVKEKLAFNEVFNNTAFEDYNIDFTDFDKVLFYDFFNDVRDTPQGGDLFDLISSFKRKAGYPSDGDITIESSANNLDMESLDQIMKDLRGIKTEDELNLLRRAIDI